MVFSPLQYFSSHITVFPGTPGPYRGISWYSWSISRYFLVLLVRIAVFLERQGGKAIIIMFMFQSVWYDPARDRTLRYPAPQANALPQHRYSDISCSSFFATHLSIFIKSINYVRTYLNSRWLIVVAGKQEPSRGEKQYYGLCVMYRPRSACAVRAD